MLARRLVEAGCRFVGVDHSGWDTHFTCFPSLEKDLIPSVDMAFSALVSDLHQRGLLDSTLVVMMGEMGRTPRINAQAGRDHWSMAQSVLFAGGGIKPGTSSAPPTRTPTAPTTDPVGVEDILCTLSSTLMGIDTNEDVLHAAGPACADRQRRARGSRDWCKDALAPRSRLAFRRLRLPREGAALSPQAAKGKASRGAGYTLWESIDAPDFAAVAGGARPDPVPVPKAPEPGYIFPPGGKAGTTVNVQIAGFDWTPDLQFFFADAHVKLELLGPPGPILVAPPPYWFGPKGTIVSMPMPREMSARLTLPADLPPGPIRWQVANANGGSTTAGTFWVGTGPEFVEDQKAKGPQRLPALPVTVNGRLWKIEEVDRYRFRAPRSWPHYLRIICPPAGRQFPRRPGSARRQGSGRRRRCRHRGDGPRPDLHGSGRGRIHPFTPRRRFSRRSVLWLSSGNHGRVRASWPPCQPPVGAAKHARSSLSAMASPRGRPGWSLSRAHHLPHRRYRFLFLPPGNKPRPAPAFRLFVSDRVETVAQPAPAAALQTLVMPAAITGCLERTGAEDRYRCHGKKGDIWSLAVEARRFGSPLDVSLAVLGPDGKELARNDDLPGTTDAGLRFTVPADGEYALVVADVANKSGSRAAVYRLTAERATRDFTLTVAHPPERADWRQGRPASVGAVARYLP